MTAYAICNVQKFIATYWLVCEIEHSEILDTLNSDWKITCHICPNLECIFRSLLQFLVKYTGCVYILTICQMPVVPERFQGYCSKSTEAKHGFETIAP